MASYLQTNRPMAVTTPLGADVLLLTGLTGGEGLSQLFSFQLDLIAELSRKIAFDKLLGQPISVRLDLAGGKKRFFHGICNRVSQGEQDTTFASYRIEIVPKFWLLGKRTQSRTFQQVSVPDILKKVLTGLDADFQLQGKYEPRDYCVQYRESDLRFASRLMEEEGIYYYFKHEEKKHTLVIADTPQKHAAMPEGAEIIFETIQGGSRPEHRIYSWEKTQDLRSGKVALWDHCFELPGKNLEGTKAIQDSVAVGTVTHSLKTNNGELEQYDYPGAYAQRFDGVNPGGGDRAADVEKIFKDNLRTAEIRMQQETSGAVSIQGQGSCRNFTAGHKFTLSRHSHANGEYVLTQVRHTARLEEYRTGNDEFKYQNTFNCIPLGLPYRPAETTAKPVIEGSQTATVVGPKDAEVFTDKYGRVKVQFHWDRLGKNDADSSCWVRVGQLWAGKRWGASFWPRIGQEVIVSFLEGDPDQPIIVGSVYNADQMPPYLGQSPDSQHPDNNLLTGVKSHSSPDGKGFNEWRFNDAKGKEQIFIHAERNHDTRIKNDQIIAVGRDRHMVVGTDKGKESEGDLNEKVCRDYSSNIMRHRFEKIEGNSELVIGYGVQGGDGGNLDVMIEKDIAMAVGGSVTCVIKGTRIDSVSEDTYEEVLKNHYQKIGKDYALEAGGEIHIKAATKVVIEGGAQLSLKVGGNFVNISPAGIDITGTLVNINSGGAAGSGGGVKSKTAKKAKEAKPAKPAKADDAVSGQKSAR